MKHINIKSKKYIKMTYIVNNIDKDDGWNLSEEDKKRMNGKKDERQHIQTHEKNK